MKATCRCGTCGLRWFRCTCPDMAPEHMAPESTWAFWRKMTRQEVKAYMAHIETFERWRQVIEREKQKLLLRGSWQ